MEGFLYLKSIWSLQLTVMHLCIYAFMNISVEKGVVENILPFTCTLTVWSL